MPSATTETSTETPVSTAVGEPGSATRKTGADTTSATSRTDAARTSQASRRARGGAGSTPGPWQPRRDTGSRHAGAATGEVASGPVRLVIARCSVDYIGRLTAH